MALLVSILLAIFVLPWPWSLVAVCGGAAVDLGEAALFLRFSRPRRSSVGVQALVGRNGVVTDAGQVRVAGELWAARGVDELRECDRVVIRRVDGLVLDVEPN
ncbi:MAG: NfeD family protein [Gaiellaceae bacterium]